MGVRVGWARRGGGASPLFTINRVLVVALLAAVLGTLTVHRCTRTEALAGAGATPARATARDVGTAGKGYGASLRSERSGWRYRL
ncbi:MAG: hypothetical protein GWO40_20315 [Gammaproteobacteria bacterium]|nr:hypothetical protein [Gammaproteobacteria bacterium]NIU06583.1 hypothetical protein [Gammaproteobacteria bacterium]NIV53466.1 hypothetical protein [Gammaproteobacteria bacterium]NIW85881.1 hypothetical protein [Gammaproteobacteria bacterium]NIX87856.1 hypothetical protein [Gammaproteobacteria bacterium]